MEALFFWFLAGVVTGGALGAVSGRNPVACALSLAGALVAIAALYVTLEAFFLAVVQTIIYAGAVMVLFLFVIMLLNVKEEQKKAARHWPQLVLATFLAMAFLIGLAAILSSITNVPLTWGQPQNGAKEIGKLLFTHYLLPFMTTGVLLLLATLGVVFLSKKELK